MELKSEQTLLRVVIGAGKSRMTAKLLQAAIERGRTVVTFDLEAGTPGLDGVLFEDEWANVSAVQKKLLQSPTDTTLAGGSLSSGIHCYTICWTQIATDNGKPAKKKPRFNNGPHQRNKWWNK